MSSSNIFKSFHAWILLCPNSGRAMIAVDFTMPQLEVCLHPNSLDRASCCINALFYKPNFVRIRYDLSQIVQVNSFYTHFLFHFFRGFYYALTWILLCPNLDFTMPQLGFCYALTWILLCPKLDFTMPHAL